MNEAMDGHGGIRVEYTVRSISLAEHWEKGSLRQ